LKLCVWRWGRLLRGGTSYKANSARLGGQLPRRWRVGHCCLEPSGLRRFRACARVPLGFPAHGLGSLTLTAECIRVTRHHLKETNMKTFLALFALVACSQATAADAFFTGKQEQVQTVTYKWVWRCQYNYNGQLFWRLFETSCPSSVKVQ
jgi:hypothetical protein